MTYIEVNGLPTWHEIHSAGQPVVLLHAAFAEASSWSAQTLRPSVARGRRQEDVKFGLLRRLRERRSR